MSYDVIIRGGTVVDGTGAAPRTADVAISDGVIAEVGRVSGPARRTIDADGLWLSPCYKRPSVAIHFTWKQEWDAVRGLLPVIEKELAPYKVRPHWGKLFAIEPGALRSRYERLGDFKDLAGKFDPRGKFRNEFLARNLYD